MKKLSLWNIIKKFIDRISIEDSCDLCRSYRDIRTSDTYVFKCSKCGRLFSINTERSTTNKD